MSDKEKIRSLVFANDIASVKQGWNLLESLGEPIENMLAMLDINLSKLEIEQHTWNEPNRIIFTGAHCEYNTFALLNLLLKHNIEGVWDITTLHLSSDPSEFEFVLKLSKNIQKLFVSLSNKSLVEKLPSLFPNVQEIDMTGDKSTHFTWQDNGFSNLRKLWIIESHELRKVDVGNNLRNIEDLCIYAGELSDFSFLQQKMPHIRNLSLCESRKFHDLSLITHLTTLQKIGVDGTSINTLEPLQQFPELNHLNLIWCHEVTDYTPLLSGFPKLESIDVTESIMTATPDDNADEYRHLQVLRQLQAQRPNIQVRI